MLPLGSFLTVFFMVFFFELMINQDLEQFLKTRLDGSLSGTKVRMRSGAGRSLADEGHVTTKRLGDTAVERHSSRNRQYRRSG